MSKTTIVSIIAIISLGIMFYLSLISIQVLVIGSLYFIQQMTKRDTQRKIESELKKPKEIKVESDNTARRFVRV